MRGNIVVLVLCVPCFAGNPDIIYVSMAIKAFSEIKESNMASTRLFYTLFYYILLFWGGSVAEQLERWTCNSEASSWSPALTALAEYGGGGG